MSEKYLRVTMPDGSKWDVPASVVASDRANYYDEEEPGCFQREYDYALNDEDELIDWARGNMDWTDVVELAREKISPPQPDYQEGWVNGDHEVIQY